jgi:hypothetical protein
MIDGCGGVGDDLMILFVIRIEMVGYDLCLSFFVIFARRSKSHSYSAAILPLQPRGATTIDGDGLRQCVEELGAPCSSFGLIVIYLESTVVDTFVSN